MNRPALLPLAALVAVGFAPATVGTLNTREAQRNSSVITAEKLRWSLDFIASDALQGRDTPSVGLDAAGHFLVYNLKRWGAKPGGVDGTFYQPFKLVRATYDREQSKVSAGSATLALDTDFLIAAGTGTATAEAISIAKEVGTTDVKGKIVLLGSEATRAEEANALRNGAIGVIRNSGANGDDWRANVAQRARFATGYRMEDRNAAANTTQGGGFRINTSNDAFAKLTAAAGSGPITIATIQTNDVAITNNIVAIIEGSDPKLKNEYVAIGAHYDHVGVGRGTGDQIFNGADDDGSGTVSVLAIAEAALTGKNRPKRSLLLVWHAGEEKGLWGSAYFVANPTVPKESIVAQLNIDMIGRSKPAGDTNPANRNLSGPNDIYVIGTTMMSTRLGELVHKSNNDFLKITYDPKYDAPDDPNRFFFRSDHYNYARAGIPIAFWFCGVHEDYHRPGDEAHKIDYERMARLARTIFVTAVNVANEPSRPAVDKPLNR